MRLTAKGKPAAGKESPARVAGKSDAIWGIWLFSGNDARWLEPHTTDLVRFIRESHVRAGYSATPGEIIIR